MIYLVLFYHGLNLQEVYCYTGEFGKVAAETKFEALTGISYSEYKRRREADEGNDEILSEDDEGTEIYVLSPITISSIHEVTESMLRLAGGNELWKEN